MPCTSQVSESITALKLLHSKQSMIKNSAVIQTNSILVSLGLSSAFDTVDHNILIYRLENYIGLSGSVIQWFRSYLKERTSSLGNFFIKKNSVLTVGCHKVQFLVHCYSTFTCSLLVPSYRNTMCPTVPMSMIHSYMFHFPLIICHWLLHLQQNTHP